MFELFSLLYGETKNNDSKNTECHDKIPHCYFFGHNDGSDEMTQDEENITQELLKGANNVKG